MYSVGRYKAEGRFGLLQLSGSGLFQGNFCELTIFQTNQPITETKS